MIPRTIVNQNALLMLEWNSNTDRSRQEQLLESDDKTRQDKTRQAHSKMARINKSEPNHCDSKAY